MCPSAPNYAYIRYFSGLEFYGDTIYPILIEFGRYAIIYYF